MKELDPTWSIETNLVFNSGKTKFMLIGRNQLSAQHNVKMNSYRFATIATN